ncbi:hypothetical protein EMCRGX_G020140 [Ephydatia muelleri]
MFKKLKKKLEEGEEGGMDFTPRRLPGSVVRSSSGDAASMAGTDSDVAAGTKEGDEDRSLSREGFDLEWYSAENSRELALKSPNHVPEHLKSAIAGEENRTSAAELLLRGKELAQQLVLETTTKRELESSVQQLSSTLQEKEQELGKLLTRTERLEGDSIDVQLQIMELQEDKAGLQKELEERTREHMKKVAELESERDSRIASLMEQLTLLQQAVTEKDKLNKDQTSQLSDMKVKVKTLESRLEVYTEMPTNAAIEKLYSEIADTERRLRSRNFEIEVLETRLAAQMKERLDEQEAAIELQLRLEASCKDLTQKLEQLRSEYQQSTRELEGQREEGERRDARMGMLEVELQQCTHKYQQLELQCGEAEGRHRAQMEEVSRHHSAVMQGMEEELVEARVQISALQEELKSLQVSSCTEVHAMDCTSQGEEGEPAILQVDTCDGHTREDTELESLRTEVSQLQEELAEKNKTIKLQLQKMADMKKALHKELKPQVSVESTPAVPTPSTPKDMTRVAIASEVNFQYLKNVVIKFICSREEEALQLICALSTLLELSPQEVEHIKQYLEYKSSWFGSQPTPLQYQRHSQKRSI